MNELHKNLLFLSVPGRRTKPSKNLMRHDLIQIMPVETHDRPVDDEA
jgi:hypothetical protein